MLSAPALADLLPDQPWLVEIRAILCAEEGEIFGLRESPDLSFALWERETSTLFVIGSPPQEAIRAALQPAAPGATVIAQQEQAAWLASLLSGWKRDRIIVHSLSDNPTLPDASEGEVAFLDPSLLHKFPIPEELLEELASGSAQSPLVASFVNGQPVAFCYAGATTEGLWDVSIDTLPEYQRQGHAARVAAFMIRHMRTQGKQPVWQSLEENPASWRLALKLGFVSVDDLVFFELPD